MIDSSNFSPSFKMSNLHSEKMKMGFLILICFSSRGARRHLDLIADADALLIELVYFLEVLLRHDRVDIALFKCFKVSLDLVKVLPKLDLSLPILNPFKIVLDFAQLVQI